MSVNNIFNVDLLREIYPHKDESPKIHAELLKSSIGIERLSGMGCAGNYKKSLIAHNLEVMTTLKSDEASILCACAINGWSQTIEGQAGIVSFSNGSLKHWIEYCYQAENKNENLRVFLESLSNESIKAAREKLSSVVLNDKNESLNVFCIDYVKSAISRDVDVSNILIPVCNKMSGENVYSFLKSMFDDKPSSDVIDFLRIWNPDVSKMYEIKNGFNIMEYAQLKRLGVDLKEKDMKVSLSIPMRFYLSAEYEEAKEFIVKDKLMECVQLKIDDTSYTFRDLLEIHKGFVVTGNPAEDSLLRSMAAIDNAGIARGLIDEIRTLKNRP